MDSVYCFGQFFDMGSPRYILFHHKLVRGPPAPSVRVAVGEGCCRGLSLFTCPLTFLYGFAYTPSYLTMSVSAHVSYKCVCFVRDTIAYSRAARLAPGSLFGPHGARLLACEL